MAKAILIIGKSGSGKSTSIRNLDPSETFIINVEGKDLPFRGGRKKYMHRLEDGSAGNYCETDDKNKIIQVINFVNTQCPHVKNLIIDDFGYTMSNSFMRKALVKGYDKFSELAKDAWDTIELSIKGLRSDLQCFIMMHSEVDDDGKTKPKTVGKMVDQYVTIEGKFTVVLHTTCVDGKYYFITNDDGYHMARSPGGMFVSLLIENDLSYVKQQVEKFVNAEDEEDVPQ